MTDTAHLTGEATDTEQTITIENFPSEESTDAVELDEELEEELIIEDFTIDGICGVY
jgi:mycofactocin precursor